MEKLDGTSMNIVQNNIEKLKEIFPEIFSENKIDFEALKAVLGEEVEEENERYSFNWHGKNKARRIAQEMSTGTILPVKEDSKNWENTDNLYIEGDNLEVLKLLQKSYHSKVKMIYIDPPYNTGKDFVYPDNFKDNLKNYLEITGQVGEDGQKLSTNSDSSGRYHSDWLNMMYPRLKLARNLLKDDGVIFISIDDNEVTNLKKICDEIFGEENKIGLMTIQSNPRGSQASRHLSNVHEYILMYSKNASLLELKGVAKSDDNLTEYSLIDSYGKNYRLLGLRQRGGAWKKEDRPLMHYPIYINPENGSVSLEKTLIYSIEVIPKRPTGELSRWTWGKEKLLSEIDMVIGKKVNRNTDEESWDIFRKDYLHDSDGNEKTAKIKTMWIEKDINYQNAKNEIKKLFENSEIFDYPKPTYIVRHLTSMLYTEKNNLILDFFSGSATTAHAVMQLNAEDGGNRKYIMVQLPEPTPENSEASKAGYKNICEIGKERIRRAGEKIKSDETLPPENREKLDTGFKVFRLSTSNIKEWDSETENLRESLFDAVDNIKSDRTSLDVLYEILLKYGLDLNVPIVENKDFYSIGGGTLLINLDTKISLSVIDSICEEYKNLLEIDEDYKTTVVLRDNSFQNDVDKTNAIQRLKQAGIKEIRSI